MREEGDTRLASVYKPKKRGSLEVRSQKASILGIALAACRPQHTDIWHQADRVTGAAKVKS